jgi:hypothetical protein
MQCLKYIQRDLVIAKDHLNAAIDCCFKYDSESGKRLLSVDTHRAYGRLMKRWHQIFKDLMSLRSYRAQLAYWFWTSRVGNPPVLR